jgi:hypothetical protein
MVRFHEPISLENTVDRFSSREGWGAGAKRTPMSGWEVDILPPVLRGSPVVVGTGDSC